MEERARPVAWLRAPRPRHGPVRLGDGELRAAPSDAGPVLDRRERGDVARGAVRGHAERDVASPGEPAGHVDELEAITVGPLAREPPVEPEAVPVAGRDGVELDLRAFDQPD